MLSRQRHEPHRQDASLFELTRSSAGDQHEVVLAVLGADGDDPIRPSFRELLDEPIAGQQPVETAS